MKRTKKAPARAKKAVSSKRRRTTKKTARRSGRGSVGAGIVDRAKDLISHVAASRAKPRTGVVDVEAEVAKVLESRRFMGRYIVEAPTGERKLATSVNVQVNRHASAGPYTCSADGKAIGNGKPYMRVEYQNTRRVDVRERACPDCQNACLTVAAATGTMPMPSDLMKALKHLAVTQPEQSRWEKMIGELNGRYVGNAVDVRVFDYSVDSALKAKLLEGEAAKVLAREQDAGTDAPTLDGSDPSED